jgi:hypothetical protein
MMLLFRIRAASGSSRITHLQNVIITKASPGYTDGTHTNLPFSEKSQSPTSPNKRPHAFVLLLYAPFPLPPAPAPAPADAGRRGSSGAIALRSVPWCPYSLPP